MRLALGYRESEPHGMMDHQSRIIEIPGSELDCCWGYYRMSYCILLGSCCWSRSNSCCGRCKWSELGLFARLLLKKLTSSLVAPVLHDQSVALLTLICGSSDASFLVLLHSKSDIEHRSNHKTLNKNMTGNGNPPDSEKLVVLC